MGKDFDVFKQKSVRPKISLLLFHFLTAWYTRNLSHIVTFQQQSESNWQKRGNKIHVMQTTKIKLR